MSHGHSGRAACGKTNFTRMLHSEKETIARSVTAVAVGSGALLGGLDSGSKCDMRKG